MQDSTSVNPKHHLVQKTGDDLSLSDVNGSIEVPENGSFWRKLLVFLVLSLGGRWLYGSG